jgi:two-component system response regulator DevR
VSEAHASPLRVLLADESELIRLGVKAVLAKAGSPAIDVVGEAASIAEAVRLCVETSPHVLLLDMRLPDGGAADLCRQVFPRVPGLRAIVLTAHEGDRFVYEAITAGVHGYLLKTVKPADLIEGVRDVAAGRSILDVDATTRVLRLLRRDEVKPNALSILAKQERRVLALVAEGLTNKQVAQRLGLSSNTVKNYLMTVFEKLKVERRAQATAIYVQAADARPQPGGEDPRLP